MRDEVARHGLQATSTIGLGSGAYYRVFSKAMVRHIQTYGVAMGHHHEGSATASNSVSGQTPVT